jgi:hypothetical protein
MVVTDSQNKAVSWCARRAVCFTGLARIDRAQKKPVSHWIAETLADHATLDGGVEALRANATEQIKKLPKVWDKRLSIVVAGIHDLVMVVNGQQVIPIGVVRRISNFENPDRGQRFDEFVVATKDVPFGQNAYLYGQNGMLLPGESKVMNKALVQCTNSPMG